MMNRALLVQEIIRAVLIWVDSPATALAFALSAHAFCELGLEAVWEVANEWDLAMAFPEQFREIR